MRRGEPISGRHRIRPAFTIRQLMGLVVYAAVACACAVPAVRLWEYGIVDPSFLGALVPPVIALGWAATSMLLVRRGRGRTRLVASLLLFAVSVGLICTLQVLRPPVGAALAGRPVPAGDAWGIALMGVVLSALLGLFAALGRLLMRTSRRSQSA
ncbi:hypothetical protein [Tautonia marina]|uniref:hypothetical protein n=1 Tax=Tautonia marina TaxID=2653855 RepID=UPI0012606B2B|nr:hypothetical protein [Tautonia marina]